MHLNAELEVFAFAFEVLKTEAFAFAFEKISREKYLHLLLLLKISKVFEIFKYISNTW